MSLVFAQVVIPQKLQPVQASASTSNGAFLKCRFIHDATTNGRFGSAGTLLDWIGGMHAA